MINFLESIESGWGLDLILWFQSFRTELVSDLFAPFNYIGTELGILIVLPLIYWCVNKSFGRRLFVITLFSSWLNLWCKNMWKRPRPFMLKDSPVIPAFDYHATYGLPSGHTMFAATTAGYTIREVRRVWFTLIGILFILLMGLSRMVHGVHFPQDIIVGVLISLLLIFLFGKIEKPVGKLFFQTSVGFQVLLSLLLGAGLFFLYRFTPADPKGVEDSLTLSALTAGVIAGIALEERYLRFSDRAFFLKKAARYLLGLAGLILLYIGLRFPSYALINRYPDSELLAGGLRIFRYGSLGLWVTWGAPLVFLKIKLAIRE